ncbi:hypothetical protein HPP92_024479 [Vanilla planifolia]|uniref:TCP domain-containing protein n=1 Tax=Vanilla planifolia TaxID=51239 RepID=A0A835PQT8_VANPL|nr:hypothetical protein HPP92_024479 [Vanilla planifolia]
MGEAQRRPRGVRTGSVGSGEIVEVQGGHIVRATGRKDRHSKVCTAKGLRDRRVRLSAHTAIQFYDVQDRLGYDRPSKAVDWLIKNAKPAIDQLAQLPPWRPTDPLTNPVEGEKSLPSAETDDYGSSYGFREGSSFLPPPLDSNSIADTIKFPMTAASSSSTAYPSASDLLSHGGDHAGDLRLSLHSVQDPIFHNQHNRVASLAFEAGGSTWLDPSQRATAWNLAEPVASATAAASGGGGGYGGYLLGVPPQLVQNQF